MATIDVFVVMGDDNKLKATGDVVFGSVLDTFLKREDAEFAARTIYWGRATVRKATLTVLTEETAQ